ncbi:hypothetical protein HanXRQr2_Chr06g0262721 [Helianthus annuus]|uniref:Uncharacterized protein n=1 Tax=Helianthus annuus TaxID=4232 RepID=A0A251TG69_HELAN|nr:hypothetical protein HanXRQr2_Chr06g0262721 [Helianthus annuus]KAJ0567234.1 hypothetical protein HanIR_Chr06g0282481 [Helianthus annuus]KAJ0741073.1 hypothetical protein HanOQP8_Chr06g0223841 [Helianthus annuus]
MCFTLGDNVKFKCGEGFRDDFFHESHQQAPPTNLPLPLTSTTFDQPPATDTNKHHLLPSFLPPTCHHNLPPPQPQT